MPEPTVRTVVYVQRREITRDGDTLTVTETWSDGHTTTRPMRTAEKAAFLRNIGTPIQTVELDAQAKEQLG